MLTVIICIWLLGSAIIGFWVAHDDTIGNPENQKTKQRFAYHFVIVPAAIAMTNVALSWQAALAVSLILIWSLRWAGLGLGPKKSGIEFWISRLYLPIYFGCCIALNYAEPLRYFFAVSFTVVPFSHLREDLRFQSVARRMESRAKTALLLAVTLLVVAFLGIVEVIWRSFGVDGWVWAYAYYPLIVMGLTFIIILPLAHFFPDKTEN